MSSKKGKFTAKAHSVLGLNRPSDMRDFLGGEPRVVPEGPAESAPADPDQSRNPSDSFEAQQLVRNTVNTESRDTGNTNNMSSAAPLSATPTPNPANGGKTEREEF